MLDIFILLSPNEGLSNYIRGECLKDYLKSEKIEIIKFKKYFIDRIRFLKTISFFVKVIYFLNKEKRVGKRQILYILNPEYVLLNKIANFYGFITCIDVNDAYHLDEFQGKMKAFSLFKNSKMIVFESQEYRDLILSMNYKIQKKAFIIEDTPQNEFCCINYQTRRNQVIWLGTNHTSKFLKDYFHYFHYFNDLNYQICFLGIDIDTEKFFKLRKIRAEYFNSYDRTLMEDKLLSSKVSFVPYSNVDIFKYRGNLKTKLSMAYGCVVIASNLDMHKRLINNGVNGYLYDNFNDFKQIRHTTSIFEKVSKNANNLIISQYTRSNHAQQILDLYEKSSNVE